MPKLNHVRCVLAVNDLKKSTKFYIEKLGLKLDSEVEGWSFLSRDCYSIMLGHCPDTVPAYETGNHNYYVYVNVDEIDTLYNEYKSREIPTLGKIETKPWNMREFSVEKPDGHRIMFGMNL
ncbi:MAG: VOC family protein [Thiohalomonadales bacterium]